MVICNKNKIRRENQSANDIVLRWLYFDGRKGDTMVTHTLHVKQYRKIQKEEHISRLQEPDSN